MPKVLTTSTNMPKSSKVPNIQQLRNQNNKKKLPLATLYDHDEYSKERRNKVFGAGDGSPKLSTSSINRRQIPSSSSEQEPDPSESDDQQPKLSASQKLNNLLFQDGLDSQNQASKKRKLNKSGDRENIFESSPLLVRPEGSSSTSKPTGPPIVEGGNWSDSMEEDTNSDSGDESNNPFVTPNSIITPSKFKSKTTINSHSDLLSSSVLAISNEGDSNMRTPPRTSTSRLKRSADLISSPGKVKSTPRKFPGQSPFPTSIHHSPPGVDGISIYSSPARSRTPIEKEFPPTPNRNRSTSVHRLELKGPIPEWPPSPKKMSPKKIGKGKSSSTPGGVAFANKTEEFRIRSGLSSTVKGGRTKNLVLMDETKSEVSWITFDYL
jgi:hypothetical protein